MGRQDWVKRKRLGWRLTVQANLTRRSLCFVLNTISSSLWLHRKRWRLLGKWRAVDEYKVSVAVSVLWNIWLNAIVITSLVNLGISDIFLSLDWMIVFRILGGLLKVDAGLLEDDRKIK